MKVGEENNYQCYANWTHERRSNPRWN